MIRYILKHIISVLEKIINKETDSDLIINNYFGNKKGTFIEIGAYDGVSFSKSITLIHKGWSGFCIEPVSQNFTTLVKNLKKFEKIKLFNLAIGKKNENVMFFVLGPFSTSNKKIYEKFKEFSFVKKQFKKNKSKTEICNQITLNNFLIKEKIRPNFDLLIIDVEGSEEGIFNGFDLEFYKPKMIIIELHDNNVNYKDFQNSSKNVYNLIINAGYKIVYKDLSDTYFVLNNL